MDSNIFIKYDYIPGREKIKKALLNLREHKCEKCNNTTWLGEKIKLELHHIDGDNSNNILTNLQLLCPNCHSFTENYGSKNKKHIDITDEELINTLKNSASIRQALLTLGLSDAGANYTRARTLMNKYNIQLNSQPLKNKENFCIDCGKPIYPESTRCNQCQANSRKIVQISRNDLKKLIRSTSFTEVGRRYGVTDNAIRKWCDKYNLPRKVSEIKQFSDEEWEKI